MHLHKTSWSRVDSRMKMSTVLAKARTVLIWGMHSQKCHICPERDNQVLAIDHKVYALESKAVIWYKTSHYVKGLGLCFWNYPAVAVRWWLPQAASGEDVSVETVGSERQLATSRHRNSDKLTTDIWSVVRWSLVAYAWQMFGQNFVTWWSSYSLWIRLVLSYGAFCWVLTNLCVC